MPSAPAALLCLSDELLSSIFTHLGLSSSITDGPLLLWPRWAVPSGRVESAASLAATCTRLRRIAGASVAELSLTHRHAPSSLMRLHAAYPSVTALVVDRSGQRGGVGDILVALSLYPAVRRIVLDTISVRLSVFREIVHACAGLEVVEVLACSFEGCGVEEEDFGLARHSASLRKLVVTRCSVGAAVEEEGINGVDAQWLALASLRALRTLVVAHQVLGSLPILGELCGLEELDLSGARAAFCYLDSAGVPQSHMDDILPRLVNLRALTARNVVVTCFFGRFLPPRLVSLDVAGCVQNKSNALVPVDAEVVPLTAAPTLRVLVMGQTSTVLKQNGSYMSPHANAEILDLTSFAHCAYGVEKLFMSRCTAFQRASFSLAAFLRQAVNLTHLDLSGYREFDNRVMGANGVGYQVIEGLGRPHLAAAIAKLGRLQKLMLCATKTSEEDMRCMMAGQCASSLRTLDLRSCRSLLGKNGVRLAVKEAVGGNECEVLWPSYLALKRRRV